MTPPWSGAAAAVHAGKLAVFGVLATWKPAFPAGTENAITGVIERDLALEEYAPGSLQGTSVLHFWVDFNRIQAQFNAVPQKGDQIVLNGVSYDVGESDTDTDGGSTLKLRRNA